MVRAQRRPKAAILFKTIPQYRRRFYELLKERLDQLGVDFILIYGQPGPQEAARQHTVEVPWAYKVRNRIIKVGSRQLYWQPCLGLLKDVDLVIVEQASKLLINYVLFLQNLTGVRKLAFWGHGKNLRAQQASAAGESVKRIMSRHIHWWFAYNTLGAEIVKGMGFPEDRITDTQNAIDTRHLVATRAEVTEERLRTTRRALGIRGDNVCIFAGGMYAERRLPFLLEACSLIKAEVPDFEVVLIGAGPDEDVIEEAARAHPWIHYVGPKFDEEKVAYFMLSKLFLLPGIVGLAVLDAFALEVPLVTVADPAHGPEIEYLRDGVNGIIVQNPDDPARYAAAVVHLLRDEVSRQKLIAGCRAAKDVYTNEEMVERFAAGIVKALEYRYRSRRLPAGTA